MRRIVLVNRNDLMRSRWRRAAVAALGIHAATAAWAVHAIGRENLVLIEREPMICAELVASVEPGGNAAVEPVDDRGGEPDAAMVAQLAPRLLRGFDENPDTGATVEDLDRQAEVLERTSNSNEVRRMAEGIVRALG